MMLTTNRMKMIDSAFESRIDVSLVYSNLDENSKERVWRNFFGQLETPINLDDAAIRKLAKVHLNGRQIKSAIKTARILASSQRVPLQLCHVEDVLRLRERALVALSSEDAGSELLEIM